MFFPSDPLLPLLAVGLDLVLGDPRGWPHPVRLLGRAADGLERLARRAPLPLRLSGALGTAALALGAWFGAGLVGEVPRLGWLLSLYLAFAGLALGSLLREGRAVLALVEGGDLPGARAALAMLVSRETGGLDEEGVCRTLAETLSENLGDGFVGPFLALALFGVPGLWAYKAVSTLDSMWGYKTERWRELGWAAARADDALAFVPARLTALFVLLAGRLMGGAGPGALGRVRRDAARMASPNAGWPMAAAAWALGSGMGGPAVYHGRPVDKPRLGPDGAAWDPVRVRRLCGVLRLAGLLVAAAWLLVALAVWAA